MCVYHPPVVEGRTLRLEELSLVPGPQLMKWQRWVSSSLETVQAFTRMLHYCLMACGRSSSHCTAPLCEFKVHKLLGCSLQKPGTCPCTWAGRRPCALLGERDVCTWGDRFGARLPGSCPSELLFVHLQLCPEQVQTQVPAALTWATFHLSRLKTICSVVMLIGIAFQIVQAQIQSHCSSVWPWVHMSFCDVVAKKNTHLVWLLQGLNRLLQWGSQRGT